MERIKKTFLKTSNKEKGITLVALVITIVILIILATIAIQFAFGENGLINRAQEAKNYQANADAEQNKFFGDAETAINEALGGKGGSDTGEPFEPVPTPEPPTGGADISSKMTNGIIEIKWLSGTSNNVSDTPNAPVTKSISNGKMELVKFDSSSKTWVPGEEYSYTKGTGSSDNNSSKWANARVTIDDVDSYFVWIPRYAYRIIYFDSADSKKAYQEGTLTEADAVAQGKIIGYSDSRGIVDASGKKAKNIASTPKTMVSKDYFMVHPAFMDGSSTGFQNGEWNAELLGIWIGKYETAGISSQLKVQPGVSSLRYKKIGDMYTVSKNYSTELKSHMLKNSEWGAVAYLTESTYGRNGTEIAQNKNSSYITGSGETSTDYTSEDGKKASSTGNEYGIYDLSGGAYEYVAGYYKDGGSYISNGSSFTEDKTSDEYSTAYGGTDVKTAYKYGDATMETKSWHSDYCKFVNSDNPFFRGGSGYGVASVYIGVFCYFGNHR